MKKLILSLLAMVPIMAQAYDVCVDGIYYNLDNSKKSATVTQGDRDPESGISNCYSGDIVLPGSVSVSGVSYVVDTIGDWAFRENTGLTSIVVPNSIKRIGEYSFFACSGLKTVTIGNGLESIHEFAFAECDNATSLIYADGTRKALAIGLKNITSVTIPNTVTVLADSIFYNCVKLTQVVIPDGVTKIGKSAFEFCLALKNVNLPESVTEVGSYAFEMCDSIPAEAGVRYVGRYLVKVDDQYCTSATIKAGTKWIGDRAFQGCTSLQSITIPEGVTHIGVQAFEFCQSLPTIQIPSSVVFIDGMAFSCCDSITTLTIPSTLKEIAKGAFYNCANLRELVYAEGCTTTFELMINNLTSVQLPSTLTSIADNSFLECATLTTITIPQGVTRIGDYAFLRCSALPSINIPNSVKTIGNGTFCGCKFKTVTLPEGLTTIGETAFADCDSLVTVNIPQSVTTIGFDAFSGCNSLPVVNNLRYADTYLVGTTDNFCSKATIREGTRWIGSNAFYACTDLVTVTFPTTLEQIEAYAFAYCNKLKGGMLSTDTYSYGLHLPRGLKKVGYAAFGWCSGLKTVTIPYTVTRLDEGAFGSSENIMTVTVEWATPLDLPEVVFDYRARGIATLKVPTGTKSLYEAAAEWKEFSSIEEYQCNSIQSVEAAPAQCTRKVIEDGRVIIRSGNQRYTLDGIRR